MFLTIERNGKRFDTTVTPTLGERSGLGFAGWDERGEVQLGEITPNLPAEKGRLKKGDLLIAVNGSPSIPCSSFRRSPRTAAVSPWRSISSGYRGEAPHLGAAGLRQYRRSRALDDRRHAATEAEPGDHPAFLARRLYGNRCGRTARAPC